MHTQAGWGIKPLNPRIGTSLQFESHRLCQPDCSLNAAQPMAVGGWEAGSCITRTTSAKWIMPQEAEEVGEEIPLNGPGPVGGSRAALMMLLGRTTGPAVAPNRAPRISGRSYLEAK
ncbi:hypothetical protein MAPG_00785 [Magnaporthiopsis poae ATCC 64411]|uniref:Uncharacterized protein n=1 Tax=Magnaporthiopsis poae (strain ATCC 64411 / 73-15) TaxID=644358 RepID=A0A0C4DLY5_MAGP6|nr:hypothetical protein MAPG_00785 [Magnaporthiopsis poae ATCC 64411]